MNTTKRARCALRLLPLFSSLTLGVLGCTREAPTQEQTLTDGAEAHAAPAESEEGAGEDDTPPQRCARGIEPISGQSLDQILSDKMERLSKLAAEFGSKDAPQREFCDAMQDFQLRTLRALLGRDLAGGGASEQAMRSAWDTEAKQWNTHFEGCRLSAPTWSGRAAADYYSVVATVGAGHTDGDTDRGLKFLRDLEAYFPDDEFTRRAEACLSTRVVARAREARPPDGFNALFAEAPPTGVEVCDELAAAQLCVAKTLLRGGDGEPVKQQIEQAKRQAERIANDPASRDAEVESCTEELARHHERWAEQLDCG